MSEQEQPEVQPDTTGQQKKHVIEGISYAERLVKEINNLRDLNLRRIVAKYTAEQYTQQMINDAGYSYLTPAELENGMLALAAMVDYLDNPANSIRAENNLPIPLIYDILRLLP